MYGLPFASYTTCHTLDDATFANAARLSLTCIQYNSLFDIKGPIIAFHYQD